MAAFCPCPKNLCEAKLKSFGLTALAEEISRRSGTDRVAWLLVTTFMHIYNEKEQAEQEKIQNEWGEEKIKGLVTSGQDPSQLSCQFVKRN